MLTPQEADARGRSRERGGRENPTAVSRKSGSLPALCDPGEGSLRFAFPSPRMLAFRGSSQLSRQTSDEGCGCVDFLRFEILPQVFLGLEMS